MCGLFLGRSFSALLLSFQCSCFQQLSGLNHLFTIFCESHPYIVSVWAVGVLPTARASSQLSSGTCRTGSCFCLTATAPHYQKQTWDGFVDTWPHVSGRWRRHLPMAQKHESVTMTCTVAKGDKLNSLSVVSLFSVPKESSEHSKLRTEELMIVLSSLELHIDIFH